MGGLSPRKNLGLKIINSQQNSNKEKYKIVKIKVIGIGKSNSGFIESGMEEYRKRLKRYANFEEFYFPDVRGKGYSEAEIMRRESELFRKKIDKDSYVVLLDENGKSFTSLQFANFISKTTIEQNKTLTFLIGGPYGFDESLRQKTDLSISLSAMTFTHQMVRIFLYEQIYRAFTIIKGEPYHHA